MDKELEGLQIYIQNLVQSPFDLLRKTMHLTATIAGDTSALLQISWLENEEYTSLAIHEKRVELRQLQDLSLMMLKKAEIQLQRQVKMGLKGIKNWNWK